ncbi:MAG: hypothetical protein E2O50_02655 [Gammaproteobacteria bacterium]|nr:MAG: hypothetical protein E2O50_02655 [Gammaproteobacteria bacterium]
MRGFMGSESWQLLVLLLVSIGMCGSAVAEGRITAIDPALLPKPAQVQAWHERKAAGIHTFTGSPSWQDFMTIVEEGMNDAGVVDVIKDRFNYLRWYTADDPSANQWSLMIDDQQIPVASYWAYSGSTDNEGVTAPLIIYDKKAPPDSLAGKIVVFQVPALEEPLPAIFQDAGYEFATDPDTLNSNRLLAANQWFQTNYVTRFGRFNAIIKDSGAAGALVIFSMGPERAAGLYTFPLLKPGTTGVPGLYLDRLAGQKVLQAAADGEEATLRLLARREEVEGYFYTGFLPGRHYGQDNDEYVFLITHADGPNLTQDNGGFALLSIVQYFAQIAQADRPRTLVIMLDSQHFTPHRHMDDWYAMHPDIVERIVATIGVEHLGQREYVERGEQFVQSGLPETTIVFVQDNDLLISGAIEGIKAFAVPRAMVQSPPRGGQGNWSGMSDVAVKKNYPGYGISTNMSAYWSTRAGIETFDKNLFIKQVGLAAHMTGVLMTLPVEDLSLPVSD